MTKLWIWIFELKIKDFLGFLNARFTWIIWIFAPKKYKSTIFVFFFTIFWRENSNSDRSFRNKLFFGTKIQIHDFVMFSDNWIFGHNWRFSYSVNLIISLLYFDKLIMTILLLWLLCNKRYSISKSSKKKLTLH